MGIRFQCPNGHKLHVKEFLAGKRGICPECNVKFLVPEIGGCRVESIKDDQAPDSVIEVTAPFTIQTTGSSHTASPTIARWAMRRQQRKRRVAIAIALATALVGLLAVLLWVLWR